MSGEYERRKVRVFVEDGSTAVVVLDKEEYEYTIRIAIARDQNGDYYLNVVTCPVSAGDADSITKAFRLGFGDRKLDPSERSLTRFIYFASCMNDDLLLKTVMTDESQNIPVGLLGEALKIAELTYRTTYWE